MKSAQNLTVVQLLPKLSTGGVERGTVQIAEALGHAKHRSIVVSEEGSLSEQLTKTKATHINWPIGRKSIKTFQYVSKLRDLFLSEKVDIVHARSRVPAWIGRLALATIKKNRRPAWVTTVHGPYTVNPYSRIMVSGERVIAISEFIRNYILTNYKNVGTNQVVTIPRGVDHKSYDSSFHPDENWLRRWSEKMGARAHLPLLTIPARLTRWKGQEDFLEILKLLKERKISFHGLIVGGAAKNKQSYVAELKVKIRQYNLSQNVSLLGNRNDLREILSISTVVFSIPNQPEAFGRTTAETLTLGTPVVGYKHGGTEEIMRNWFPDGLVEAGNILETTNRTQKFLQTTPLVRHYNLYTSEKMQEKTISLYENLVKIKS